MERILQVAVASAAAAGQQAIAQEEGADGLQLDQAIEGNTGPAAAPPAAQEEALNEDLQAADVEGQGSDDEEEGEQEEEELENDDYEEDSVASNETYSMGLTSAEYEWALAIKEAIRTTEDLEPLNDFMIAQIALVTIADDEMGNLDKAKERVRKLQTLRQNYEIPNTLESGKVILKLFVEDILPGFVLSFYYHSEERCYVLVLDLTKFDMSIFSDPDKVMIWLVGVYYFNHCQNPDLAAVRAGMIYLAECQGYYWKSEHMFQVKAFQEWAEIASGYPLHFQSIMHFHTGLFLNLMTSVGKKFLPPNIARRFKFGYVSEHGRLDRLYLVPSLEAANQRILYRLEQALELRYQNEASFVL